ncbi:MAG: hypothetical protein PVH88_16050 [Ignavibacteria bacterium]
MRKILKILNKSFLFLLLINAFLFAQTKTIFVAPDGSDSNDGTSPASSLQSINNAVVKAEAGDTVLIMSGRYREIIYFTNKNGLPDEPIYIIGNISGEGEPAVIDGGAEKPSSDASNFWLVFENSSWIEIINLKFENGWTNPIQVTNSSYLSFKQCDISGGRRVIYAKEIKTHHILIENCYWDQGGEYLWTLKEDDQGVDAWTSMHHENMHYFNGSIIDFRKTGGSIVIRNNKFINNFNSVRWRGAEGCDANIEIYNNDISYVRDNDFEPEVYTYNLHIYHNKSFNVHRNLSIDDVGGGYIYYYGNLIITDDDPWTQEVCLLFWKIYGNRNLDYPLYLFNNSFYGCANAFEFDVGNGTLIKHFNNAYYFLLDRGWKVDNWHQSNEFDYDISNKDWAENLIVNNQEKHGKIADIKYAEPAQNDFRLSRSSPGIDAGNEMTLPELDWTQTYSGNAPDVGAYENGELVEGPPFRFMIPPNSKIEHKEKPRIVRHKIKGNALTIYFSDQIDTVRSRDCKIKVFAKGKEVEVISAEYQNTYRLDLITDSKLDKHDVSILFNKMPLGMNGENATYWASTIRIKKDD